MTRVVHVRKAPFDTYIGRSFQEFPESIWANPFHLGKDGNRKEVLAKYRAYILSSPELFSRVHELRGKTLGCWCRPKFACHGDILAEFADITDSHGIGLI